MKLRAPSPALVIAFIALLVSLSATAYAATRITRSSQIKNNIIKSVDIRNQTLSTKDFSKSTLKRIDSGGGSSSAAAAVEGVRKVGPLGNPANSLRGVATLTITKGAYVITAKTTISGVGNGTAIGTCRLDSAGDVDQADTIVNIGSASTPGTMYMQSARTLGGTGAIRLECASSVPWNATNTSIIAQKVGSSDKKEIGG